MIYLSTGGLRNYKATESIRFFVENGITSIELSGGLHEDQIKKKLVDIKGVDLALHNYFPVPKNPFVLNLASLQEDIIRLSIKHVKEAIDICADLGVKTYSIHGGFLIDPSPNELGKKIGKRKINDRTESLTRFIANINLLSRYAKEKNVMLLLENNVLGKKNYRSFGCDPLLMTRDDECLEVMGQTDENVKLLVDVGHLKVTANTLEFSPFKFLEKLDEHIQGYHLSDNNGDEDENKEFSENSWFWSSLKDDIDYFSIEVYSTNGQVLREQLNLAMSII